MMEIVDVEEFIGPLMLNQEARPEFAGRFSLVDEEVRVSMSSLHCQNGNKIIGTQIGEDEGSTKRRKEKESKKGEEEELVILVTSVRSVQRQVELLRKNDDLFMWNPEQMQGVERSTMEQSQ